MSAAHALARAEAAGVRLHLRPDGRVTMQAAAAPPADVVADLRRWREDVARILAMRRTPVADLSAEPPPPDTVTARALALLTFAEEAYVALASRERDPIEEAERAAVSGGGAPGPMPRRPTGSGELVAAVDAEGVSGAGSSK